MKIELSKYRVNKPYIENWVKENSSATIPHIASSISIALVGCPIIVVYHYIGEIVGFTDEINASIERIKNFYQITEVVE